MIASCPVRTSGERLFGKRPILSCVPAPCGEGIHERMLNLGTQNEIEKYRIEHNPEPENITRVYMLWQPSDTYQDIEQQQLPSTPTRTGYTVAEQGGIEI